MPARWQRGRLRPPRSVTVEPRLRIRRATGCDISRVLKIERDSFQSDAWDSVCFREYLRDPDCLFLIAEKGERTVGYSVAVKRGRFAQLDSIAVAPSARGQHVATKLLGHIIRNYKAMGLQSITLMVRQNNDAAILLYRSLGFSRVRRINEYYEDGAAGWKMRLPLINPA